MEHLATAAEYLAFLDRNTRHVSPLPLLVQLEHGGPTCHASQRILRRWQRSHAATLGLDVAAADDMGRAASCQRPRKAGAVQALG